MLNHRFSAWITAGILLACAGSQPARLSASEFPINGQRFTVPDGFEIELAGGTNVFSRPVSGSFDDQGRFYVTDSSGSNLPPAQQVQNPTHRVLRLEDTDGDGKFDKSTVFAENVMFPQGCLWHAGSVYVAGPPSIWKFTDADGDGVSDQREEWFKGGTLTGCANDIHGPYLGPDGYIYWTKGAFSEQTHERPGKKKINDRAAHVYRSRPDGSDLDVIMSGGMDNPVEVAFTPDGETIFSSTFIDFSQPGWRDGIAHAVYGGVYGKVNDVLEDGRVKRTSPDLLHPFYQAGPAAECGLCRYEGAAFGAEYRDNLFGTTFNLHKVTRHVLRRSGASYASTDSDFVVSDSQDFHPTDVLEDADGSLLVIDTGGWYKLCCPSSQLAKPDVLGAVYRVRKKGAPRLAANERRAAYARLAQPPAMQSYDILATVKRAAWKADPANAGWFRELLDLHGKDAAAKADSAHLVRAAAEGLGRIADSSSVPNLFRAISKAPLSDPVLQHSLIFALIEIAAKTETRAGLKSEFPSVQRAALIALDQMDGGGLQAGDVLPFLSSSSEALRSIATWVFGHHPEWASEGAVFAGKLMETKDLASAASEEKHRILAILASAPGVQTEIARRIGSASANEQALFYRIVADAHPKELSPEWIDSIRAGLASPDDNILRGAVAAARALSRDPKKPHPQASSMNPLLLAVSDQSTRAVDLRFEALLAVAGNLGPLNAPLLELCVRSLDSSQPPALRAQALQVVQRARLDNTALLQVAGAIPGVGPLELPRLLFVFEAKQDEMLGRKILAALRESKAARSLPAAILRTVLAKYPESVQAEAAPLLQSLDSNAATQTARLETLLSDVKAVPGDIRRGQAIFNSTKTACSTCHKMGYLGGTLGPDLTSIGQARTERDLLESIVFPSATFVRSYEPVIVSSKAGDEYGGVLKRDTAEEVIVATGANAEVRLARAEVASLRPGAVSVMPQGLDEQLSKQELADLVSFLKNTKWGPQ